MKVKEVADEIEGTMSNLIAVVSAFSNRQLNAVPFSGSWTAGQVAEHIIKSIGGVPDTRTTVSNRPYDEKIGSIRELFLDFNLKAETDPFLAPEKTAHDTDDIIATLDRFKQQHIAAARSKDLTELCLDMELPTFGYLTRYEWLRFMMVHTQRHTRQIEKIYEKVR